MSSSDKQNAVRDYTTAINFSTDDHLLSKAYEWRGDARSGLFDKRGAIDDYEEAIKRYVLQSMALERSRVQKKLQKLQIK